MTYILLLNKDNLFDVLQSYFELKQSLSKNSYLSMVISCSNDQCRAPDIAAVGTILICYDAVISRDSNLSLPRRRADALRVEPRSWVNLSIKDFFIYGKSNFVYDNFFQLNLYCIVVIRFYATIFQHYEDMMIRKDCQHWKLSIYTYNQGSIGIRQNR